MLKTTQVPLGTLGLNDISSLTVNLEAQLDYLKKMVNHQLMQCL
jgi:hypothetical protein